MIEPQPGGSLHRFLRSMQYMPRVGRSVPMMIALNPHLAYAAQYLWLNLKVPCYEHKKETRFLV